MASSRAKSTTSSSPPAAVAKEDPITSKQGLDLAELGTTGLNSFGGLVMEDSRTELQGQAGAIIRKKMVEDDPICGSMAFCTDNIIRGAKWTVVSAKDKAWARKDALFVTQCLGDMSHSWGDAVSEIVSFLTHGYQVTEPVFKIRVGPRETDPRYRSKFTDRRVGWRKFAPRSQTTITGWQIAEDGGIMGAYQQAPPKYERVFLPIDRILHFRTTRLQNNPEGRSILRSAHWPYKMRRRFEIVQGIGYERNLSGLPVFFLPPSMWLTPEGRSKVDEYKKIGRNLRKDEQSCLVLPMMVDEQGRPLSDFKLMSSSSRLDMDAEPIINRYALWTLIVILADFILLGHEGVGSYALAEKKARMFTRACEGYIDRIAEVMNEIAIPRLCEANGMYREEYPKLTHESVQEVNLIEMGSFISQLTTIGVDLTDPDTIATFRRAGNLPPAPPGPPRKPKPPQAPVPAAEPDAEEEEDAA